MSDEVTDKMSVIFQIKCSASKHREFDEFCKAKFGDARWVMLDALIKFYAELGNRLESIESKLQLVDNLANKYFELEGELNGNKSK